MGALKEWGRVGAGTSFQLPSFGHQDLNRLGGDLAWGVPGAPLLNSWKSGYQKEVGRLESNVACGYGGVMVKYRGTLSRAETAGMGLRPGSAEGWRGEMIER